MTEQSKPVRWTIELESIAAILLQGGHAWQIANSYDLTVEQAEDKIAQVRHLWGLDATGGIDPGLDQAVAQVRRVQERAWAVYQDHKDSRYLRVALDAERELKDLRQRARDCVDAEADRAVEKLAPWVPTYLGAWGCKREDGKRVTVGWAAEQAGTTDSNVRNLRQTNPRFRRLEELARYGRAEQISSMIQAGLRGSAPVILQEFMRLVQSGNAPAIMKAMEWLQDKPSMILQVLSMSDDEILKQYSSLLETIGDPARSGQAEEPEPADQGIPGEVP